LDQVPQLYKKGTYWAGSFRADGQTIVVDEATIVSILPNMSQKSAMRREAKEAKQAALHGDLAQTAEQMLSRLDDVHVNMYVSYEGARLDDGRIAAKKVQFRDNEMTAAKARLWKSLAPRITAFQGTRPGELNLGAAGRYKLTPNAEVQKYIRDLGQRLLPASQRGLAPGDPNRIPFQFFVAESKAVNAHSTANGVVVVNRELLAMVETEGQLAAVIGHEIAHATQEHMLRQMEFHKKKRMLLEIGAAVAAAYGKYNVRDLLTLASAAIKNGYSRYLENQADRVGMEYMLAAGYDPREAPRVWKTMSSNMGDRPTDFFWSSHDNNTTRRSYLMSELAVNYKGVEFDSLEKDNPEFHHIRAIVGGSYSNARAQHEKAVVRLPGDSEPKQKGASAAKPAPLAERPQPTSENVPPPDLRPLDRLATFDPNLKPQIPGQLAARAPPPQPPSPQPAMRNPQPAVPDPWPSAPTLDRAYEALRAKDYETAIAGFVVSITADPDRTPVRQDLAYTYLKVGENSLARSQFQEVLRRDPNNAQVALEYAFLSYDAKDVATARRIFDRLRKEGNATAEQAFHNIDAPLAAGIDRWKEAIERGANDFSAHYELATLAEQRDELPLAAEHYEKAWRVLPDRRSVLVDLGRVWKALNRDADATAALLAASRGGEARAAEMARELLPTRYPYVSEFRHALDLDSANVELRRELAFLLLGMGHPSEAEQEFRDLAAPPANDLLAVTQLGFLLYGRGDHEAARPFFDRVLAGNDEDLANRVRAVLHVQQVQEKPPDAVSAKVMAERSIKAGYMKDALKYLQLAHEADPDDTDVMLRLGWAYNLLHQDVQAVYWFGLARQSSDPKIAAEADRGWRNLRSATEAFRFTAWLYPMFSTRWHDAFGYGQVKADLRTGLGFRPYLSVRFVGDSRQTTTIANGPPQYLSESSVIVGLGLATTPWHGLVVWGEAGESFNYLSHHRLPDYRGGLSLARGTGHSLRAETPGWFADIASDAVFVSRFNKDVLFYNQGRFGYTAGPKELRLQLYGAANLTLDDQRQYWANFGEGGLGIRFTGSFLPPSMYFTFEGLRGVYLVNEGNPRRPNFNDFRAGLWYAFTR